jgi:hypothetical protein
MLAQYGENYYAKECVPRGGKVQSGRTSVIDDHLGCPTASQMVDSIEELMLWFKW